MERYRPIQKGYVFARHGAWFCQYRDDTRDELGHISRRKITVMICPAADASTGRQVTKREAERLAYETVLRKVNQAAPRPATLATVEEFYRARFLPEHVEPLKAAGRKHYSWIERRLLAHLGKLTMREVSHAHIQQMIHALTAEGLSAQTAAHYRNAASALFRHAQLTGAHQGPNPATGARVPVMRRARRQPLTFQEAHRLMEALPSPARELAFLSMVTSLNIAEMAALRAEHVNLDTRPRQTPEATIPPAAALVCGNYYAGEFGTTKAAARVRVVPLPPRLLQSLRAYAAARPAPEAALFFQNRVGKVISADNLRKRTLQPAALKVLGRPVGWHDFRRCTATWADWVNMPVAERVAIMGHATPAMTMHYTADDTERRRPYIEQMENLLYDRKEDQEPVTTETSTQKPEGPKIETASVQ